MPRLTRAGASLATAGLGLLGIGMATANLELLVVASLPLLLLAVPLGARAGRRVAASRTLSTRAPRRGDTVDVALRLDLPAGRDLVEVYAPVPDGFTLDAGTNLLLEHGEGVRASGFRLRAHARGRHRLGALKAEALDPLGLLAPRALDLAGPEEIEVAPRTPATRRLRRRGRPRAQGLLPDREEARLGVGSTDFRELRDYAWGDPPRSINWKATARRLSSQGRRGGASMPLVNEYEKEGRRTVIILLDGGASLRVGTTLETGLDHAVEAALAAAHLYLDQGARVGAATFGARAPPPAAPDGGPGHVARLERALSPAGVEEDVTAVHALQSLEPHLAGSRPFVLVVTRVTARNAPALAELARRLRVLSRDPRRHLPLQVVDVRALRLAPAASPGWHAARALIEAEDAAAARELVQAGARVVPWVPGEQDFRATLLGRGAP